MKTKNLRLLLAGLSALLVGSVAHANGGEGLSLGVFRVGQLSFIQTDGNCFTGIFDWLPTYHLSSGLAVRAYLGGTLIKTKSDEKKPFLEGGALLSLMTGSSLSVEAGLGLSDFVQNGGNRLTLPANIVLEENWGLIQHAFLGYAAVLVPTNLTHEIRIGVGTHF